MAPWRPGSRRPAPAPPADGGPRSLREVLAAWDGSSPVPEVEEAGWAPGARDGIALHHLAAQEGAEDALVAAFRRACRTRDEEHFAELYAAARATRLAPCWQAFLDRARASAGITSTVIREVAARLRRRAAHVEPVKLGFLLAAALHDAEALPDVEVFGRHEEFGFWCVLVLQAAAPDPVASLLAFARGRSGWAKVHAVARLALEGRGRPEVRAWLLRHGCRNGVMDEYLAAVCATAGGLDAALAEGPPDDELLEGAATILRALFVREGPAPTYAEWKGSVPAARAFLEHLAGRPVSPAARRAVQAIGDRAREAAQGAEDPPEEDDARARWLARRAAWSDLGFTREAAARIAAACDAALAR